MVSSFDEAPQKVQVKALSLSELVTCNKESVITPLVLGFGVTLDHMLV